MPTVAEILKQTGFTDQQIADLDPKAITAFSGVLSTAEQERAQAQALATAAEQARAAAVAAQERTELEKRSNIEFYETKIIPGLTGWEEEQKRLISEAANEKAFAAFYKAQNEAARNGGFVPAEAPQFTPNVPAVQPRNPQGQYVPGAPGGTPGSPTFTMEQVRDGIGQTMGTITDVMWEYEKLHGNKMPISPTELVREAEAVKLDPKAYAERKFNFAQKREEIRIADAKKHDESIAAAARLEEETKWKAELDKVRAEQTAKERKMAEGLGNNPEIRQAPGASRFSEVRKAVAEGTRPDPLKMTDAARRQATRQMIHSEISDRETQPA